MGLFVHLGSICKISSAKLFDAHFTCQLNGADPGISSFFELDYKDKKMKIIERKSGLCGSFYELWTQDGMRNDNSF